MGDLQTQEKPTQPIASDSMSASIEGYELPAGKYAWNLGCCQWVICICSTASSPWR